MSILSPKTEFYQPPDVADTSDLFKYIAEYNGLQYYDTDSTGVTPNEIQANLFFINRVDVATPAEAYSRMKFDGVLFIGQPSDIGTDVNASSFSNGQYDDIVKVLLNLEFVNDLRNYIACDYQVNINSLRPLYNSVKYTKATNCTGVEVAYSIWI
jgi:hypothetical protein